MLKVLVACQSQDHNALIFGIHNPVFGYACLCILHPLYLSVPSWVVWAHDFHNQVRTEPTGILPAGIVGVQQQQKVRFTVFPFSNLYKQWGKEHSATKTLCERV